MLVELVGAEFAERSSRLSLVALDFGSTGDCPVVAVSASVGVFVGIVCICGDLLNFLPLRLQFRERLLLGLQIGLKIVEVRSYVMDPLERLLDLLFACPAFLNAGVSGSVVGGVSLVSSPVCGVGLAVAAGELSVSVGVAAAGNEASSTGSDDVGSTAVIWFSMSVSSDACVLLPY